MTHFEEARLVIGLGAARTGTKWMSSYFAGHPEILMPERLMHFFDTDQQYNNLYRERLARALEKLGKTRTDSQVNESEKLRNLRDRVRMIEDPREYIEFYRRRWSGEKAFADITPSYCQLNPEAYERMRAAHSKVLFFFVLRNPIERLWSDLRVHASRDHTVSPYQAVDRRISSTNGYWPNPYKRALECLDTTVPASDAKVLFFEKLFSEESIRDLCDFIRVRSHSAEIGAPQNQADPFPLDNERRSLMYRKLAPVYEYVALRYNAELPESWRRDMDKFG